MKTEFTEFQKEAMKIVDILRIHQEELEELLQGIFPNVIIKITARGLPIYNPGTKDDTLIYQTDGQEYLITASGANHLVAEWYNDKLFITFINYKQS